MEGQATKQNNNKKPLAIVAPELKRNLATGCLNVFKMTLAV